MTTTSVDIQTLDLPAIRDRMPQLEAYVASLSLASASRSPRWLLALAEGLGHKPYCIEARDGDETVGVLPLEYLKSPLFGRFLVGMPYLNVGGPLAEDPSVIYSMIDEAVRLADTLDVKFLELRNETRFEHPALTKELTSKVHMRLPLPESADELWKTFKPKVRNQVRKGEKCELTVHWGRDDLLREFYDVFARNMRDLGTPVFGKRLFRTILRELDSQAELCVVRNGSQAIAGSLLIHGPGTTEVPSASSLRQYNTMNANMLMYWHLLTRAIERGQQEFDFGRSSVDSGTFRFKRQWCAEPHPAVWQYYVRHGDVGEMRPDNAKYQMMIRVWQKLPVPITRIIGPPIIRGVP